jgi:hypothetical protein
LLRSSFLTIKGLFTFTQSYCHSAWPIKSKQSSSLSESPQCSQYSSIQKSNKSFLPHRCLNVHHHSPSSAAVHAFLTPVEIQLGTIAALQMSVISHKGQSPPPPLQPLTLLHRRYTAMLTIAMGTHGDPSSLQEV